MRKHKSTAHLQTPAIRSKRVAAIRAAWARKRALANRPAEEQAPASARPATFKSVLLGTAYAEWPGFCKNEAQQLMFTVRGKRVLGLIAGGQKVEAKQALVELLLEVKPSLEDL